MIIFCKMLPFAWLILLLTSSVCRAEGTSSSSESDTLQNPLHLSDVNLSSNKEPRVNTSIQTAEQYGNSSIYTFFRLKPKFKNESSYYAVPAAESFNPKLQRSPTRKNLNNRNSSYPSSVSNLFQMSGSNSNNQNLMHLVRNVDTRLRNMRNVEMRVAIIQEIFDSMDIPRDKVSSSTGESNNMQNNSEHITSPRHSTTIQISELLQTFSKRLSKKLQKATHVVMGLRDFFHVNITKLLVHDNMETPEYNDNDNAAAFGFANFNSDNIKNAQHKQLFLHTLIESCQEPSDDASESSYNKAQIQILNFLKNDVYFDAHNKVVLQDINDNSFEANRWLADKIRSLHNMSPDSDVITTSASSKNSTASTTKSSRFSSNNFKHIYFLSRSDHASDNSIKHLNNDLHFRHLYVSAIMHKYVLILIDVGSSLTPEQLGLTKKFVLTLLKLLSEDDLISIVTIGSEASTIVLETTVNSHQPNRVYSATRDHKEELYNYINNLRVCNEQTNHTLGFEYSLKLLETLQRLKLVTQKNPIQFVYITRGLLTNLSEATHVLSTIAKGQQKLIQPIVINTCAVVLDEKRIMYEKQFLRDIAHQNYSKYDIDVSDWYGNLHAPNLAGSFFIITKKHPEVIERTSTAIFDHLFVEPLLSTSLEVHSPVVDISGKDTIVSFTHVVSSFGIVGVNLFLTDLVEDVVNYITQNAVNKNESSYAFLIDRKGIALAHPALARPATQSETPFPVDIGFLENSTDFTKIKENMLFQDNGNITTTVFISKNNDKSEILNRNYLWQRVRGIYIMCLAYTFKPEPETDADSTVTKPVRKFLQTLQLSTTLPLQMLNSNQHEDNQNHHATYLTPIVLLYHRLDLLPPQNSQACRYFRQIVTLDFCTVYLSTTAFESPFAYLQNNRKIYQNQQKRSVESIMAYLKDTTGLLANPGLRKNIRYDVATLYKAMQHLKKRHQDPRGSLKNYIVRRYIATTSGVLLVYPGCMLSSSFEPTSRTWFRKAMQHPGKVVITEPYLDAGGAGYIITIAHTIFEGKLNSMHSIDRDTPVAVIGMDMPYAFFYKLIIDSTPLCRQNSVKCLLFENEGYLVAHPSMLEPSTATQNQRRPHEHLTHKESFLANDILYHKKLVRKVACANYQNRTIQRYLIFNTSLTDTLTNVVHGERTKYAITLIQGSNIFAAVLNSTCDGGAFCPCSTIDRICLNCNRMDQTDCECPCECPMDLYEQTAIFAKNNGPSSELSNIFRNYTRKYPYCEPINEDEIMLPVTTSNVLHPCLNINCDIFSTQYECLGVIGCEWCQLDVDGNKFTSAFCTSQLSCFNGVLSSHSPYSKSDDDSGVLAVHVYNTNQKQNSYSTFGPIGGAIIVLVLVIGCAIYFYRYNQDAQIQEQFYADSLQDDNYGVPLSRFNFHDCQANDEAPCGYGNAGDGSAAQRNNIHPANISPYNMSSASSYHRPPNGESDHGYSTMTPHEDFTDHQSFTLAEPLLLIDKRHSKSDTISISTSISSPTNRHQQYHNSYMLAQTGLRDNNSLRHIIAAPKELSTLVNANKMFDQTNVQSSVTATADDQLCRHFILAPVTVHRHMETTDS